MAIDPIKRLKQIELADLRRQEREERRARAAIRKADRRERRREAWPRWTAWWEKRAGELKIAATVVGSIGIIGTGVLKAYQHAGDIWHRAKRAWSFYADRGVGVGAPDQPPASGVATVATDRFEREHPPDAGPPK